MSDKVNQLIGRISLWALGIASFLVVAIRFLGGFLSPQRKSEALQKAEELNAEIEKRQAERDVETDKQVAVVEEQKQQADAQDSVEWANEIIKRN